MLRELEAAASLKAQETSRGRSSAGEMQRTMERSKAAWEASVKASRSLEVEVASLEAAIQGESKDSEAQLASLREELASLRSRAEALADAPRMLAEAEARKRALSAEVDRLKAREAEGGREAVSEQAELQDALSEARSSLAKWEQEARVQRGGKEGLSSEVGSLRAEARELTEAHAREVERLSERLASLERSHDSLDASIAQEEASFAKDTAQKREALEARVTAGEGAMAELSKQLEEVRAQLGEERAQLAVVQREREAAEEGMREASSLATHKADEAEAREVALQARLAEVQQARAKLEKEAAEEKARVEGEVARMEGEAVEVSKRRKEAVERTAELERQWVAEASLRKSLHNQLQELVGNLRVFCRVRPLKDDELQLQQCVTVKG